MANTKPQHREEPRESAHRLADAGIYSELPQIHEYLAKQLLTLQSAGFVFLDARPIPYGTRMVLQTGETEVGVNIYYSRKKGLSFVVDRNTPKNISENLYRALRHTDKTDSSLPEAERRLKVWTGSDEAGKGDFLGPLVTAAIRIDKDIAKTLTEIGVRDSKHLKSAECRDIARKLYQAYRDRIGIIELVPETYNRLYNQFRAEGKNLNHLLAWTHAKAIENILDPSVESIVVDKFANGGLLEKLIGKSIPVLERPRAETNPAVAAASILARARYLYRLEKLSDKYGIVLPPGAGAESDKAARTLVAKHGPKILRECAKLHFKNMQKLPALLDNIG